MRETEILKKENQNTKIKLKKEGGKESENSAMFAVEDEGCFFSSFCFLEGWFAFKLSRTRYKRSTLGNGCTVSQQRGTRDVEGAKEREKRRKKNKSNLRTPQRRQLMPRGKQRKKKKGKISERAKYIKAHSNVYISSRREKRGLLLKQTNAVRTKKKKKRREERRRQCERRGDTRTAG